MRWTVFSWILFSGLTLSVGPSYAVDSFVQEGETVRAFLTNVMTINSRFESMLNQQQEAFAVAETVEEKDRLIVEQIKEIYIVRRKLFQLEAPERCAAYKLTSILVYDRFLEYFHLNLIKNEQASMMNAFVNGRKIMHRIDNANEEIQELLRMARVEFEELTQYYRIRW